MVFDGGSGRFETVTTDEISIGSDGPATSFADIGGGGAAGVRYASDFSGTNGGEKIQKAIDDIVTNEPHGGVVVVGPEGPDTFTPSSTYSSIDETWNIANPPLTFGDNITLYLQGGATIAQSAESTETFVIKPKDTTNGQTGFALIGESQESCLIHGNAANQSSGTGGSAGGVRLENCTDWLVRGVKLGPMNGFAVKKDGASRGIVTNVQLNQDGRQSNQDGVTGADATKIICTNIYGTVGDDAFGVSSGSQYHSIVNCHTSEAQGDGYEFVHINGSFSPRRAEHIYVANCTHEGGSGARLFDVNGDSGNPDDVRYVSMQNCGLISQSGSSANELISIQASCAGMSFRGLFGRGNKKILSISDGTVRGLQIDGVDFYQETNQQFGALTLTGGTLRGGRISDIQSQYNGNQGGTNERFILIEGGVNPLTVEGAVFENIYGEQHGTDIEIRGGGNGATLTDVTFDTIRGTPNPHTTRGGVFNSSGVTYNNVNLRNLSLPAYTFDTSQLFWDGVLGGGPVDGVDLGSVSGQHVGQFGISDGTTNTAGKLFRWDGSQWSAIA
jgi:hypothetical protein